MSFCPKNILSILGREVDMSHRTTYRKKQVTTIYLLLNKKIVQVILGIMRLCGYICNIN